MRFYRKIININLSDQTLLAEPIEMAWDLYQANTCLILFNAQSTSSFLMTRGGAKRMV